MAVTEGSIAVPGTSDVLDTVVVTTGEGAVHREMVSIGSPENPDARAEVDVISKGLQVAVTGVAGPAADMFGRLRVSNPVTLFDYQAQYDAGTDAVNLWEHVTSGNGETLTHYPNEACVRLSTASTVSGRYAIRQTKVYHRYQPGKANLVLMTAVLGAGTANCVRRIGQFDDRNGLFHELDGTTLKVVVRSYVSGSAVDTPVEQSSWNYDKLDGTGPSGITLNPAKALIFIIGYQWLGVGAVAFGFDIDGRIVPCHVVENANNLSAVYMSTANLPIRWEIRNTGITASIQSMDTICCSLISEGGVETERGYPFSVHQLTGSGAALTTSTTVKPLIAIRPAQYFPTGGTNPNRGQIVPRKAAVTVTTDSIVEIQWNPVIGDGSWIDVNANNSITQYNNTCTTITTGGLVLASRPVDGSNTVADVADLVAEAKVALARNYANSAGDIFAVCVRTVSGAGSAHGSVAWQEFR